MDISKDIITNFGYIQATTMQNFFFRNFILLILFAFPAEKVLAQVTPSLALGNWLAGNGYGQSMTGDSVNGWQIYPYSSRAQSVLSLDVTGSGIGDLSGIEAFLNMQSFRYVNAYGNITLRTLPPALLTLDIENATITGGLPVLPMTLTKLICSNLALTSLPQLPSSIQYLDCEINNLTSLPPLPISLKTVFDCSGNQLTSIPPLPDSLLDFRCNQNRLISLPSLPPALQRLRCYSNQLLYLPNLPSTLLELDCSQNPMSWIPDLPSTLPQYCTFPTPCNGFVFRFNNMPNLYCLPKIPQARIWQFNIGGSPIACMPNRFGTPAYVDVDPNTLPLCTPSTGCNFYYSLSGKVHIDTSSNCIADSLVSGPGLANVKIMLLRNGNVEQQCYTSSGQGEYTFAVDSIAYYELVADTNALPFSVTCPLSGSRNVQFYTTNLLELNQNFGMSCNQSADYRVFSILARFRPSYYHTAFISAGNLSLKKYGVSCGSSASGTITTIISGPGGYVCPAPGALTPTSVSGKILTYNISNLDSLTDNSLNIITSVDSSAVLGESVCITVIIKSSTPDYNLNDDTLKTCFIIQNSYDPNLKEVYPFDSIKEGDWLTYNIHFQNTGNDTAFLVVVKDTLSNYLIPETFQYLASSNHAVIQLFGNNAVFTFPHINLVDSATNPTGSEGWIQYKVKSKSNIPTGKLIKNTASIYFDTNPAITTNTTVNPIQKLSNCVDTNIVITNFICQGDSFIFRDGYIYMPGIYIDTFTRMGGCDSIVTLQLHVLLCPFDTLYLSKCIGDTFVIDNMVLFNSGIYNDTVVSSSGLGSVTVLQLTLNPLYHDTVSLNICQGDTLVFGNQHLTVPGTYNNIFRNSTGCDSAVNLQLNVFPLPLIRLTWDSLISTHYMGRYSDSLAIWCPYYFPNDFIMHGGTPVGGVYYGDYISNNIFLYDSTGTRIPVDTISYVIIDTNGCRNYAQNYIYIDICEGINDIANTNPIKLYPNPNAGTFTLETVKRINSDYIIYDMLGKIVQQENISADKQQIYLPDAPDGVYTLVVKGAQPVRFVLIRGE